MIDVEQLIEQACVGTGVATRQYSQCDEATTVGRFAFDREKKCFVPPAGPSKMKYTMVGPGSTVVLLCWWFHALDNLI